MESRRGSRYSIRGGIDCRYENSNDWKHKNGKPDSGILAGHVLPMPFFWKCIPAPVPFANPHARVREKRITERLNHHRCR